MLKKNHKCSYQCSYGINIFVVIIYHRNDFAGNILQ